jgi:hypothetical protein
MLKTNDQLNVNGFKATISINNVIIFHVPGANVEFWKDEKGYYAGIANLKNGNETRYSCYPLGSEPKKWKDLVQKIKDTYDQYSKDIEFTNYVNYKII